MLAHLAIPMRVEVIRCLYGHQLRRGLYYLGQETLLFALLKMTLRKEALLLLTSAVLKREKMISAHTELDMGRGKILMTANALLIVKSDVIYYVFRRYFYQIDSHPPRYHLQVEDLAIDVPVLLLHAGIT